MWLLFDYLFSFAYWRINFLISFFFFNCNFDFFYQQWQIIKQNTILFMKKLWCRQVMMNKWLIMSVLKSCYNGRQIPIILPLSVNGKIIQTLKKKQTFLTNIFCLNVILYQMTVRYQKIKHILQKQTIIFRYWG